MAESNYREYLKGEQVRVKKYFYVLRPILAAKWILDKECPPPMLFSELMEAELENSIKSEVDKLLKMKQELPEMGLAPRVQVLNNYIENELINIKEKSKLIEEDERTWKLLNEYFISLVKAY